MNRNYFKALLLSASMFACANIYAATQDVIVVLKDGTEKTHSVDIENGYIQTSKTDVSIVENVINAAVKYSYNDIKKIVFDKEKTAAIKTFSDNNAKLFPNPAENFIKLINAEEEKGDATIFSIDGKSVMQVKISDEAINISSLQKGEYILKTKKQSFRFFKK